jgi:hypothetical protein
MYVKAVIVGLAPEIITFTGPELEIGFNNQLLFIMRLKYS